MFNNPKCFLQESPRTVCSGDTRESSEGRDAIDSVSGCVICLVLGTIIAHDSRHKMSGECLDGQLVVGTSPSSLQRKDFRSRPLQHHKVPLKPGWATVCSRLNNRIGRTCHRQGHLRQMGRLRRN